MCRKIGINFLYPETLLYLLIIMDTGHANEFTFSLGVKRI